LQKATKQPNLTSGKLSYFKLISMASSLMVECDT